MTRIIISRHDSGDEKIVAGWDRPLETAFVDYYDEDGECLTSNGPMAGEHLTPDEATNLLIAVHHIDRDTAEKVKDMLDHHRGLVPPESNHIFDIST